MNKAMDTVVLEVPHREHLDTVIDSLNAQPVVPSAYKTNTEVTPEDTIIRKQAFAVVDPWSTGNKLCQVILSRGFELVLIWPANSIRSKTISAREVLLHPEGDESFALEFTLRKLRNLQSELDILGVLAGSETGVLLAERLAYALGVPTNDPAKGLARRNKYLMGEAVRNYGIRAVEQTIATNWSDVEKFLQNWNPNPFKVVVKPNMGAGSDDVHMCRSLAEVKLAFDKINGSINSLGIRNDGVLIQEFLEGREYVVDTVSRNGNHKAIALWEYDKREANNRFNVYYGSAPICVNGEMPKSLVNYIFSVLDALGVQNGPGHAELIMTKTGPCLVEIGCRCHGGNASWYDVVRATFNIDQINALISALSDNEEFANLPKYPTSFHRFGAVLDMVSYEQGEIESIPGLDVLSTLPSFKVINLERNVGSQLKLTIDCNSTPGQIILIHDTVEQVMKDFDTIHSLLRHGFFILKNTTEYDSDEPRTSKDSVSSSDC